MLACFNEVEDVLRSAFHAGGNRLVAGDDRRSIQPPYSGCLFQFDTLTEAGDFASVLGHRMNSLLLHEISHLYAYYTYMHDLSRALKLGSRRKQPSTNVQVSPRLISRPVPLVQSNEQADEQR